MSGSITTKTQDGPRNEFWFQSGKRNCSLFQSIQFCGPTCSL